jgi:hypothetical protein
MTLVALTVQVACRSDRQGVQTLGNVKDIGMTVPDLRKFLQLQSDEKVSMLSSVDELGLSG